ncbi:hypothetical protein GGI25_003814 [Coemansia spiralis]|uniref:AMP-activated protein kinase glycogen-binding domain-containing protein n=2 Tax=Coemansia TaxID=4863 RepID=A0A9W8G640_9FUNG|nr:hypothetical protein BX070DRAFT_51660 [Coemansia spiralis]KAJ1994642.1 hypothetical protein EDC05_001559 [Coemansia umbellata]KAJ2624447.1 hypothetical protein GGI26_001582 [Coemansia sp. RSA 1358]KAJ2675977.1 hypothetical protein GGI25_003814 [Coemansia spiralis]
MQADASYITTIVWPGGEASGVAIRGTFSDDKDEWWQGDIPLQRSVDGSQFSVALALRPGRYEFKFVVNGDDWRINTAKYECVDDGNGNTNNLIVVTQQSSIPDKTKRSSAPNVKVSIDDKKAKESSNTENTRLLDTGSNADGHKISGYSSTISHSLANESDNSRGDSDDTCTTHTQVTIPDDDPPHQGSINVHRRHCSGLTFFYIACTAIVCFAIFGTMCTYFYS